MFSKISVVSFISLKFQTNRRTDIIIIANISFKKSKIIRYLSQIGVEKITFPFNVIQTDVHFDRVPLLLQKEYRGVWISKIGRHIKLERFIILMSLLINYTDLKQKYFICLTFIYCYCCTYKLFVIFLRYSLIVIFYF